MRGKQLFFLALILSVAVLAGCILHAPKASKLQAPSATLAPTATAAPIPASAVISETSTAAPKPTQTLSPPVSASPTAELPEENFTDPGLDLVINELDELGEMN